MSYVSMLCYPAAVCTEKRRCHIRTHVSAPRRKLCHFGVSEFRVLI